MRCLAIEWSFFFPNPLYFPKSIFETLPPSSGFSRFLPASFHGLFSLSPAPPSHLSQFVVKSQGREEREGPPPIFFLSSRLNCLQKEKKLFFLLPGEQGEACRRNPKRSFDPPLPFHTPVHSSPLCPKGVTKTFIFDMEEGKENSPFWTLCGKMVRDKIWLSLPSFLPLPSGIHETTSPPSALLLSTGPPHKRPTYPRGSGGLG